MKKLLLIICCLFISLSYGQKTYKYYVYLYDSSSKPEFTRDGAYVFYSGKDNGLKTFFAKYEIMNFSKAFPSTDFEDLSRVLILITTDNTLAGELVAKYPAVYRKTDDITNNDPVLLNTYPTDYGNTNPNGNTGANIRRNDLDYINAPAAWDITSGIASGERTKFGLSDARINDTDLDFVNKVTHIGGGTPYLQSLSYSSTNANTAHGTAVGGIAAARGNNTPNPYGSVGICYDCDIVHASYTGGSDSNGNYVTAFDNLIQLAQAGSRVINMSWVSFSSTLSTAGYEAEQTTIDYINQHFNTVLVAGAGNWSSYQTSTDYLCNNLWSWTLGQVNYCYPASYKGVISVSAVNYQHPYVLPLVPNVATSPSYNDPGSPSPLGQEIFTGIQGSIADVDGTSSYSPIGILYNGWQDYCVWNNWKESPNGLLVTATTNSEVDVLAPIADTFRFDIFTEQNNAIVYTGGGTSGASPRVAATVALMKTVDDCLTPDEVDDILKLTSKDVESLPFNQIYAGHIGGGALDTGNAVKFVNEMKKNNGLAQLKDHIFKRFDFKLDNINNKLSIENVVFKDDCKADFTSRNEIRILPGTRFTPNSNGKVVLKINNAMDITCPSRVNFRKGVTQTEKPIEQLKIILSPNPNKGSFKLSNINFEELGSDNLNVMVFDLNGRKLFENKISAADDYNFELQNLKTGIYILKISSELKSQEIKFVRN